MLRYRLITGPILIIALLGVVWFDWAMQCQNAPPGLVLYLLAVLVTPLAAHEFTTLLRATGLKAQTWLNTTVAWMGLSLTFWWPHGIDSANGVALIVSIMALISVVSAITFTRGQTTEGVIASIGGTLFVFAYLGCLAGLLLAIAHGHSAWWVAGVVAITKACDSGAYFTGRALGRHKMIPWLSPGKTWEGAIGGVLAAIGVAALLIAANDAWLDTPLPWWMIPALGLGLAISGQLGDLMMSLLKRGARLKDSSNILPGLGGLLDVLDSPLLVAPVAYWLLTGF
ncbi:MAG: phosphatidate cytidylyltransferase [Phycisphaerales bacterium]|nr:phosphatidate cytidylyltransferase [Phycisphaerales bacterium]